VKLIKPTNISGDYASKTRDASGNTEVCGVFQHPKRRD